jgi:anti-sigma-K factor RskA
MSESDDIDAIAGEYVLGTLDAGERAAVEARRLREPALDTAIRAWERRLSPLAATAREIVPPADMLGRIERQIDRLSNSAPGGTGGAEVVSLLEARVRRWRTVAVAASSLAACLVVALGLRETVLAPQPQSYVAVFNRGDVLPAFTMTIDLATRQVTVRPVGAPRQPGRTYQLWIASDQLGPNPRSLGLLGDGSAPGKALLTSYEPALLRRATFGVSLEPAGGSPTGQPTSPALHARLQPVEH